MIDKDQNLRCDGCNKKLGLHLQGYVEMVCPRCKKFNIFDTNKLPKEYSNLDNFEKVV